MKTIVAVMLSTAHAAFIADGFEEIGDWSAWTPTVDPCDAYIDEVRAFIDETNEEYKAPEDYYQRILDEWNNGKVKEGFLSWGVSFTYDDP